MSRVDWRASVGLVGRVVKYLAVAQLLPLGAAVFYGEGIRTFAAAVVLTVGIGLVLERADPDPDLGFREGFLMVALTWLTVAVVGALPYLLAGWGTASTLANPVNALFESMSGFTTTGATVMGEISFDRHSHALLLWRQLTQWLGGMGIVVLAVAILPELSVGGAQLMDAEAPGPGLEKLTPRIAETARALWIAYVGFTVLEMGLLYALHLAGMAPNMGAYNAVAHALTTLPTGGFSPEARSIEAFSAAVQWVIIPFMVVAGTNFALIWQLRQGNLRALAEDTEFRTYVGVIAVLSAIGSTLLFTGPGMATTPENVRPLVGNLEPSVRHAVFQVLAMVTTTGYASMDFNTWSESAKYFLLFAMFIGGSAGSTGGGIKIIRWLVIFKSIKRELFNTVHPEAVRPVRIGGRSLDERALRGIHTFTLVYLATFLLGALLLSLDTARAGTDITAFETISAAASTVGNVGPGFGAIGPMNSYLLFPVPSKLLMVFLMWAGRLEILPVLVLLSPAYWQR